MALPAQSWPGNAASARPSCKGSLPLAQYARSRPITCPLLVPRRLDFGQLRRFEVRKKRRRRLRRRLGLRRRRLRGLRGRGVLLRVARPEGVRQLREPPRLARLNLRSRRGLLLLVIGFRPGVGAVFARVIALQSQETHDTLMARPRFGGEAAGRASMESLKESHRPSRTTRLRLTGAGVRNAALVAKTSASVARTFMVLTHARSGGEARSRVTAPSAPRLEQANNHHHRLPALLSHVSARERGRWGNKRVRACSTEGGHATRPRGL